MIFLCSGLCKIFSLFRSCPWLLRTPWRRRRLAGAERGSRFSQGSPNRHCGWVLTTEHAPRDPSRVLERRHGLADIVERGAGVIVERRRVNRPQPKRGDITLPEDPLRHRNHFAQQCLGLFEAPQINKGRRVAQLTFAQLA